MPAKTTPVALDIAAELPGGRGLRLEADLRHLAFGGILDFEELALREAEHAGDQLPGTSGSCC